MEIKTKLAASLCEWYSANKRELPWRDSGDPYDVWISEIMLQQTRIEAVKEKYKRFKEILPDIDSLANCESENLMRLWEGLGYYARARNLKKCAMVLRDQFNSHLPSDYNKLLSLPGIGPYTAGAISSICFNLPHAAVDGNVLRVLSRLFESSQDVRQESVKAQYAKCIENTFDKGVSPSIFNQALMELGETVCLPNAAPLCVQCPWESECMAHNHGTTETIPVRSALKKRRIVERTLLIIRDGDRFVLRKRNENGLLGGLYEFIGIDHPLSQRQAIQEAEKLGFHVMRASRLPNAIHIFTHLEWHMQAFELQVDDIHDAVSFTREQLSSLAIPSAFRVYTDYYALR